MLPSQSQCDAHHSVTLLSMLRALGGANRSGRYPPTTATRAVRAELAAMLASRTAAIAFMSVVATDVAMADSAAPTQAKRVDLVCWEVFQSKWLDTRPAAQPLNADIHFITMDLRILADGTGTGKANVDNNPNFEVTGDQNTYELKENVPPTSDSKTISVDRRNGFFDWLNLGVEGTDVVLKSQLLGVCGTREPKF